MTIRIERDSEDLSLRELAQVVGELARELRSRRVSEGPKLRAGHYLRSLDLLAAAALHLSEAEGLLAEAAQSQDLKEAA